MRYCRRNGEFSPVELCKESDRVSGPEMQVAQQERRTQPRARLSSPVVAFVGDLRIDCTALDISAVGIGMRGPRLAAPGQFLRLNFCLQTDSGVPRWFDADGVVARVVLRGDAYEFGVQFL